MSAREAIYGAVHIEMGTQLGALLDAFAAESCAPLLKALRIAIADSCGGCGSCEPCKTLEAVDA